MVCFVEKCIASWTSKAVEEFVGIIEVNNLVVILYMLYRILVFTDNFSS